MAGVTSKGACLRCGIRRGAGLLLSCLNLAWACLLCGFPEQYPRSRELVQEDLNTRATRRCQHDAQARHLGRCLLLSMSMDKSGSYLPLLTAVAALISPSALAKEQSHFQNMAQLLQLDFAWRHIPRGPGQVLCWICRGCCSLFCLCSLLPVTLPQATAPVPPVPNSLFNSGLLGHLSLYFQC